MIEPMNGHAMPIIEPLKLTPPRPTQASRWARLAKGVKAKPETPTLAASDADADLATKH
jgi:hypothetical protein